MPSVIQSIAGFFGGEDLGLVEVRQAPGSADAIAAAKAKRERRAAKARDLPARVAAKQVRAQEEWLRQIEAHARQAERRESR